MIKEIRRTELIKQRKAAGLSQADVGYKLGISSSNYNRIEAGYSNPKPEVAEQIIELLKLPRDYFGSVPTQ